MECSVAVDPTISYWSLSFDNVIVTFHRYSFFGLNMNQQLKKKTFNSMKVGKSSIFYACTCILSWILFNFIASRWAPFRRHQLSHISVSLPGNGSIWLPQEELCVQSNNIWLAIIPTASFVSNKSRRKYDTWGRCGLGWVLVVSKLLYSPHMHIHVHCIKRKSSRLLVPCSAVGKDRHSTQFLW